MSTQIRRGDNVLVIAGKDKGKSGKVLAVDPTKNTVVVSGVNIVSKHKKARSAEDKGGIIKKENKIDVSNVQIICAECGKATRIAHKMEGEKKIRSCKKCGASLDSKAAAKKTTAKSTTKTSTKSTKVATPKTTATKEKAVKSAPKSVTAPKAGASKTTTPKSTVRKSSGK